MSTVSLAVDQTCNECHDELGTLATSGLHPQQLLGNTSDKPYLSSVHSQALHACQTLTNVKFFNINYKIQLFWGIQNSMFSILFNAVHNFFFCRGKNKRRLMSKFFQAKQSWKEATTNALKATFTKKKKGCPSLGKLKMSLKKRGKERNS